LGLAIEDTVSPRVLTKVVYAGTMAGSFEEAQRALQALADRAIRAERIRRACHHVAEERIEHQQRMQEAFTEKSLPQQMRGKPDDVEPPEIACVMADGGRYQLLDRCQAPAARRSADKGDHWKESRIGLLVGMQGASHTCDPQPTLPPQLRYEALAETLEEIGRTGRRPDEAGETDADAALASAVSEGLPRPEIAQRYVVASRRNWEEFGPLLASQAWYGGFAAAERKAFVSDGSATIEKLQRQYFSHYTSILDLLHALAYSLAAARAVKRSAAGARQTYNRWAEKIWQGQVKDVIEELRRYTQQLGPPPEDARSDDPREVVRCSLVYYENHAGRMDYPRYRRAGLPLTSSLMESTVKQVSRRVKGTEKFWSGAGAEALLRLRADVLSDDAPLRRHLTDRARHATGMRSYRSRAVYA
jgi:hypothetical protein